MAGCTYRKWAFSISASGSVLINPLTTQDIMEEMGAAQLDGDDTGALVQYKQLFKSFGSIKWIITFRILLSLH